MIYVVRNSPVVSWQSMLMKFINFFHFGKRP